jgi:hypothetical protein
MALAGSGLFLEPSTVRMSTFFAGQLVIVELTKEKCCSSFRTVPVS